MIQTLVHPLEPDAEDILSFFSCSMQSAGAIVIDGASDPGGGSTSRHVAWGCSSRSFVLVSLVVSCRMSGEPSWIWTILDMRLAAELKRASDTLSSICLATSESRLVATGRDSLCDPSEGSSMPRHFLTMHRPGSSSSWILRRIDTTDGPSVSLSWRSAPIRPGNINKPAKLVLAFTTLAPMDNSRHLDMMSLICGRQVWWI